ncbi:hypothetical protein DFH06DRAFT_1468707 [Mycena polygramma]|nr:hypothetical protein DFH06DRAFT_1468707 [Mycena polygramma]
MACWSCGADPRDRHDLPPTPALSQLSAVQHLLQTNYPPADAEIPVLADFARNGRRRIDSLDDRIHDLKATLDGLIVERHELASQVQQCTVVLAPIRRVPPEIIGEIFSWTSPRIGRVAGQAPSGVPWYLGQISGIWREIALGLPCLWSSITLFHTDGSPCEVFSPLPMVQAQLMRSANAHLHVDFEWMVDEEYASPFMDARSPCSFQSLMQPAKGRLAQLHTLEINDDAREEDDDSVASDIFSIAPNLRQVLVTTATFSCVSPPLPIPWEQITRYRGIGTFEQTIHILQAASSLVDGALGFTDDDQEIPDGTVITLPQLRQLFTEQGDFLDCLTAPQVEYLSSNTVPSLLPFIQRSSCRLTTLVMTDTSPWDILTSEAVILLLQHTPALKNLVWQASGVDEEDNTRVLSALTLTGASSDLCPNLTFFAYGAATSATLSGHVFNSLIRSRCQPDRTCQLSSLRVFPVPPLEVENLLANMQTLIGGGLDVKFLQHRSVQQARYSFVLT